MLQFRDVAKSTLIEPFLQGYELIVAITMKQVEWKHYTLTLILGQFPLILSWSVTINKFQGITLEMAIIDLGSSKKFSGVTLVALSYLKNLKCASSLFFV